MPVLPVPSLRSAPSPRRRLRFRAGKRLLPWVLFALIWLLATLSLVMGSRVAAAVAALGS